MAQNVGLYVKLNSGSYVSQIKVGRSEINIRYSVGKTVVSCLAVYSDNFPYVMKETTKNLIKIAKILIRKLQSTWKEY
jgi:hypothetical protein